MSSCKTAALTARINHTPHNAACEGAFDPYGSSLRRIRHRNAVSMGQFASRTPVLKLDQTESGEIFEHAEQLTLRSPGQPGEVGEVALAVDEQQHHAFAAIEG